MTPAEFSSIQVTAGKSDAELAAYLECSPQQVRRMKMNRHRSGHRPVSPVTAQKMRDLAARSRSNGMED